MAKRLSKVAKEFNVGTSTIIEFLNDNKEIDLGDITPNTKIDDDVYDILAKEYSSDITIKQKSEELAKKIIEKESISIDDLSDNSEEKKDDNLEKEIEKNEISTEEAEKTEKIEPKIVGKIDLDKKTSTKKPTPEKKAEKKKTEEKKPETKPKKIKKETTKKQEPKKQDDDIKIVGKIDLSELNQKVRPAKKTKAEKEKEKAERNAQKKSKKEETEKAEEIQENIEIVTEKPSEEEEKKDVNFIETNYKKLEGPKIVGKIKLQEPKPKEKKPVATSKDSNKKTKKRKRIRKPNNESNNSKQGENTNKNKYSKNKYSKNKKTPKPEISEEDIQKQIRETYAKLTSKQKNKGVKHRRDKRIADREKVVAEEEQLQKEKEILKVSEFVTANELASMMDIPVTDVISTCMNLGLFVSINQRLDAETISIVADEFSFKVNFIGAEIQESIQVEEDKKEDLLPRSPIVTVMGHVDHGKTKLLDFIRSTNVVAGEAGGITQHIGAYSIELDSGQKITFLDTPGHEAFTAMRARGAQITDIAIIVIAADDGVMPQTVEAINHASAAGVPIIFAINKIDKPTANPEKIKEELANMNYLVEDWGGKYQSQEISAKNGINIDELLEKVLLEAELLELKANPNKKAHGTVLESMLDKGRGYVATILVQGGTLHVSDLIIAGTNYGHIKAMFNERNQPVSEVPPATPVTVLGLNGAPQAGDEFNVVESDKKAKEITNKRLQLQREQNLRTQKHLTLDEIGRRIALGDFQELNIIVKGDVDGSIEALSDSLQKISTETIQINILHKAVGQISESDVLLADASDAIIVGFQVRASMQARRLAEKLGVEIRINSIIYDAIDEVKLAIQGMLKPIIKEKVVCTLEIRETFKITKVGTIAGCIVKEGKIHRNTKVRIIREGIVIYDGKLGSLKRFKDDVKEVSSGYECGLNIENYNDIKVGDIIEGYEEIEEAQIL